MEYFPLILKQRLEALHYNPTEDMDKILAMLRKEYKNVYFVEPHVFCRGDSYDGICLYELSCNPRLRYLSNWIMRKLILEERLEWKTVEVRLRIAVSAMSKIKTKTGGRFLRIILQDNFVNNVWVIHRQKLMYDLPFYQG